MDKKTYGAWIIHHTHKLQGVQLATPEYEQINFAGKCGIMLNALAGSDETQLTNERVETVAAANGIRVRLELPAILTELEKQRLIDRGESGIAVLGLTTAQTLEHTASVFEGASPTQCEKAAIELAEQASDLPMERQNAEEFVANTYGVNTAETREILTQCEQIGFIDSEQLPNGTVYFNGNLFRREEIKKAQAVLRSLDAEDEERVMTFSELLKSSGCVSKDRAVRELGQALYSKMCAIGFIDENSIGNERGMFSFVTRPAAFSKFTNSTAEDAFDLAKAFVTSLTYGMTSSPHGRGRIRMIEALMQRLIDGEWVGPATAIGQDYKVLELKGVIQLRSAGDGRFKMKLLKREVGQQALSVITEGEASSTSLLQMPGVSATTYYAPEVNRTVIRRRQPVQMKQAVAHLLENLRTGGLR